MIVMPNVSCHDLQDAMEWVSSSALDNEAYICRKTGRIYWISGDPGALDEGEPPDDVRDSDKYLPVPDKRHLDLGNQLAFDFALQCLPQRYEGVRDLFRRKGAWARFTDLLGREGVLDDWYRYRDERQTKALAEWCDAEGLELAP